MNAGFYGIGAPVETRIIPHKFPATGQKLILPDSCKARCDGQSGEKGH
jgi:hypothetical protein